jgi:hypothetical protein
MEKGQGLKVACTAEVADRMDLSARQNFSSRRMNEKNSDGVYVRQLATTDGD